MIIFVLYVANIIRLESKRMVFNTLKTQPIVAEQYAEEDNIVLHLGGKRNP